VNAFTEGGESDLEILRITAEQEQTQVKRLGAVKADRDGEAVAAALARVRADAADPNVNLMPTLIEAVRTYATEGEIIDALAEVFGRYTERPVL
jgi:methylmalonyl-CoA mutase N-terminal domain/subunit